MSKSNEGVEKSSINRRIGAYAIAGLMAASCAMPTSAMAESAVAAGLGGTDVAVSATSFGRSATVAKSAADELRASLGDAPEGKQWSWVCDVAAVTRDVTTYVTSDGEEFSTYAEANQHVEDSKLTVSSTTVEGKTTWYIGSLSYDSYEDALVVCEQDKAVQDVSYVERHSADGLYTFESAEGAEQYVKDHTLTIAEKRTAAASTYVVNGNAFGTQEEADQYAQGFRLGVTEGTKVVHHDAVTHTEYVTTYYVVDENNNVLVRGLTESEAVDYITNNDAAEAYAVEGSKAVDVVNTPAWDETVAAWTTSDGQSFDTEAEADAHASANVPEVTEEAHYITTYVTSDGQSFGTLELAQAHVEKTKPSVVETTVHAYVTSDGQQFSDAESAASHAAVLYASAVKAITSDEEADVTTYVTSDGQSFETEEEAEQHVEDSKLSVSSEVETVTVSEALGHYELVDSEVEGAPSRDVTEAPSTPRQASDGNLATTADTSSVLPNTGDASSLVGIASLLTAGIASLAVGVRRR